MCYLETNIGKIFSIGYNFFFELFTIVTIQPHFITPIIYITILKLLKHVPDGLSILRMILHHPVEMRNHESLHHLISELLSFNLNSPVHLIPKASLIL